MKTKDILIAAGFAVAAFVIARAVMRPAAAGSTWRAPNVIDTGTLPGQPGYGWEYFDDGTAISPEGVYYYQGREVWRPS